LILAVRFEMSTKCRAVKSLSLGWQRHPVVLGVATAAGPAQGLPGFLKRKRINMRTSAKVISALSVAGLAVVAGSAFTGAGLINDAGSTQFVGGTVNQEVSGATLDTLVYGFTDGTKTAVNQVTLTFADATGGKTPTVTLTGGGIATFTCAAINGTTFVSVCNPTVADTTKTNVTNASVTVS
jgi:hypothetical protein